MSIEICAVCGNEVEFETFNQNSGLCDICANVEPDPDDSGLYHNGNHWYFADETEGLNGPFKSRDEAFGALVLYCKNMLGVEIDGIASQIEPEDNSESTNPNPFLSQEGAIWTVDGITPDPGQFMKDESEWEMAQHNEGQLIQLGIDHLHFGVRFDEYPVESWREIAVRWLGIHGFEGEDIVKIEHNEFFSNFRVRQLYNLFFIEEWSGR